MRSNIQDKKDGDYNKVLGASNLAMLRYEWIWYKERGTGFLNANRAPLKKSENILAFYQKPPIYNPQFTYGEPYRKTHARSGSSPNYGKFERVGIESNDGRRYPSNVLFVPTVSGGIHPTHKSLWSCVSISSKPILTKARWWLTSAPAPTQLPLPR